MWVFFQDGSDVGAITRVVSHPTLPVTGVVAHPVFFWSHFFHHGVLKTSEARPFCVIVTLYEGTPFRV